MICSWGMWNRLAVLSSSSSSFGNATRPEHRPPRRTEFLVEIDLGANMFAGANRVEYFASNLDLAGAGDNVSMPSLDCAG